MKNRYIISALLVSLSFSLFGCQNKKDESISEDVSENENISEEESEEKISGDTIEERLNKSDRISDVRFVKSNQYYLSVYEFNFIQYIDHDNKELGTFTQRVEFGFNGFDLPNVLVTLGYMLTPENYSYRYGENEIAFLLHSNYVMVEHRYFGESIPGELDYSDTDTWEFLTTYQSASDHHDIVRELKRMLDGKWVSTGGSKGGMTTELFARYYPGDVDLYVPYVAPFCNSREDDRFYKFVYEEAGNLQYGEERAKEIRDEVLEFQLKLLEYRDTFEDKYYQEIVASGGELSELATPSVIYDVAVLEFAVGFWQYYQNVMTIENCLKLSEDTESHITTKKNRFYQAFKGIISESDFEINGAYTPYYVQAYQELGNYGYDFSYIRNALTNKSLLTVEDESHLWMDLLLNSAQRELEQKELVYTSINEMLRTTEENFIILYGSSDPWYAVRPDDVTGRSNVRIYVNTEHPHTTCIHNFDETTSALITKRIKNILGL